MYKAGVALNRKSVFPLFSTTKVCGETKTETKEKERELMHESQGMNCTRKGEQPLW